MVRVKARRQRKRRGGEGDRAGVGSILDRHLGFTPGDQQSEYCYEDISSSWDPIFK